MIGQGQRTTVVTEWAHCQRQVAFFFVRFPLVHSCVPDSFQRKSVVSSDVLSTKPQKAFSNTTVLDEKKKIHKLTR